MTHRKEIRKFIVVTVLPRGTGEWKENKTKEQGSMLEQRRAHLGMCVENSMLLILHIILGITNVSDRRSAVVPSSLLNIESVDTKAKLIHAVSKRTGALIIKARILGTALADIRTLAQFVSDFLEKKGEMLCTWDAVIIYILGPDLLGLQGLQGKKGLSQDV
eukprot:253669-Pelagomonas_calceolata.AAC.1